MPEVIVINPIQNNETKKKRVAAYARVSSDSDDQLHSFTTQVEYYSSLIGGNPNYEMVDIYTDEGITGTSKDKRDDFLRMISDCRKRKIDMIITKSVARFARNTLESLETVRELREYGVTVTFESDRFNTESMADELLLTILSAKAQEEALSISENLRWSYRKRMRSGKFITTSRPYGYRLTDNTLVIDETESEIVRYIYASYLSGKGKCDIAQELTTLGIFKKNGDTTWYNGTVNEILRSEKYIGDALLQKCYNTDTLPFRKMRNTGQKEQIYLKNSHPAIISRDDHAKVQILMDSRAEKFYKGAKMEDYPLRQKVICGECGSPFRRKVINDITYWTCYTHDDDISKCGMQQIPESKIYNAFIRMYNKLKRNCDKILSPLLSDLTALKKQANAENVQIAEINSKLAELANQNRVLKDVESKGYLDSDIFIQQSNELKAKMLWLRHEKQLLMTNDEDDETIALTQTIIYIVQNGDNYIAEFPPELFGGLVEKVIVESKEQVRFLLKNGLKLTEYIAR